MSHDHTDDDDVVGKAYDARLMRRLLRYVRPYRWQVAGAITLLVLASALAVVGPLLTKVAVDDAIPARDGNRLAVLAGVYITTLVLASLFQYVQGLLTTWLGQRVMYDLRTEIFRKLQRLDLRFYDKNPVGRLMTRITNDVETLNELFASGVVAVFGDVFTLVFIVAFMLHMDWRLALVTFSVLPFVAFTAFVFRAKVRTAYRDIRVRVARINSFIHERFTGIRVVQLFNREEIEAQRHQEINKDYLGAHLRSITYYAIFFPVIELFTAIALALVVWRGGASLLGATADTSAVSIGVIAAFIQYARRFFRPIQDLSEKYNILQGAMASSERIFSLLDLEIDIEDPQHPVPLPSPLEGRIEFDAVWFAYGKNTDDEWDWVLKDVSFTVHGGEKLAIVGHTGAGKTTLVNLLMRFYTPQRGRILLDGIPIDQFRVNELRGQIGLVLQDVFLFSQDVAYNIRLGDHELSDEDVRIAAERIGAAPFIERLENGYSQRLGERGSTLSVGERQLVSFARALAFDPAILILDEATSSVDSEIEAQIEEATNQLMEGRTSLVIAHRLSTVQRADRILVFHHGELSEEGTHRELLDQGGLYARLHELQFAKAVV